MTDVTTSRDEDGAELSSADAQLLRELMLVRLAALIAVDAPPASYLANAEAAADSGVTAGDIQGVMIGVAPVVGTARVVSAGGKILRALGFAVAVADSELADDGDAGQ